MLVLVMAMGFGNTCTFSRISNIPRVIPRLYEWVYKILRLLHLLVQLWVPNQWNQGYSQSVCSQLCEFCVKNDEGKVESIILLIFLLWGCFNCWWMRGGEVGQKILFRGSLNRILFIASATIPNRHLAIQPLWSWFWSREWGGEGSPRFPFVTPGVSELPLRLITSQVG